MDASNTSIGVMLYQIQDGQERVVEDFSKSTHHSEITASSRGKCKLLSSPWNTDINT